jgi:hypothetical protein
MPVLSYVHHPFTVDPCHAYIPTLQWKDHPLRCFRMVKNSDGLDSRVYNSAMAHASACILFPPSGIARSWPRSLTVLPSAKPQGVPRSTRI